MLKHLWRLTSLAALCCLSGCGNSQAAKPAGTNELPAKWGATYRLSIQSKVLGEKRNYRVFVPADLAKTKRRYPIVFLTDGEYYFEPAVIAVHELAVGEHMPEAVVCAIETPKREQDLTPPGMGEELAGGEEKGEELLTFIQTELRPALEKQFRISSPAVLMGHSHGGILAAYAAAKWRKAFPFVLAMDAPVHLKDQWLSRQIDGSGKDGYLRLVSIESRFGWTDESWKKLVAAVPASWQLKRLKMPEEKHETMVFGGYYQGLKMMFADFNAARAGGNEVEAFKNFMALDKTYGDAVYPPERILRRALMELTAEAETEKANVALQRLIEGYGEPDDVVTLRAEIAEADRELKAGTRLRDLLAAAPSSVTDMTPYLGTWKGHQFMDGVESVDLTVTFKAVGGQVVGKVLHEESGEGLTMDIRYIRVTKDGMHFGVLNGMFPRGLLIFEGKRTGNRLQGEHVFRGVYFKYPEDMKPPKVTFSLEKMG